MNIKQTIKALFATGVIAIAGVSMANTVPVKQYQPKPLKTKQKLRAGWTIHGYNVLGYTDDVRVGAYGAMYIYRSQVVKGSFTHSCQLFKKDKPNGYTRISVTINGNTRQIIVNPNGTASIPRDVGFYDYHTGTPLLPSHGLSTRPNTISGFLSKPGRIMKAVIVDKKGVRHELPIGSLSDIDAGEQTSLCSPY